MPVPLHPAIVHVPLGLAFVLPLVALGLAVAIWRGALPRRAWWVAVGMQVLLLGGGLLASREGEREEERVERLVPKASIERHEEGAEALLVAAGLTLALLAGAALLRWPRAGAVASALAVAGTIAVAGLAVRTGRLGGELVYRSGAASAYATPAVPSGHLHDGAEAAEHGDDD